MCDNPYHRYQTGATPQRAPELISVQCIGIKIFLCPITDNGFGTGRGSLMTQLSAPGSPRMGITEKKFICQWGKNITWKLQKLETRKEHVQRGRRIACELCGILSQCLFFSINILCSACSADITYQCNFSNLLNIQVYTRKCKIHEYCYKQHSHHSYESLKSTRLCLKQD